MDQNLDKITPPSTNTDLNPAVIDEAEIKVDNAFPDIIGVVKLSEDPNSIYRYFVASPMYAGFGDLNSPERIFFLQEFDKTSPALKGYLTSSSTIDAIFSIGKDANLEDGQISQLSILIRELLTGKVFIKDFPITLSSKLGIDDFKAGEIANKIISQSFGPIIEDLKRVQRSKFPDKISQLQKESVPEKMTQPTAKPVTPRESLTPAQKITQDMPTLNKPDLSQSLAPNPPAPSTETRPPILSRPPVSSFKSPAPESMSSKPLNQPTVPTLSPKKSDSQSRGSSIADQNFPNSGAIGTRPEIKPPQIQPKPEFKIPDLSNIPSGGVKETNKNMPNKNLEEELEKIANVIDLRSKPEN